MLSIEILKFSLNCENIFLYLIQWSIQADHNALLPSTLLNATVKLCCLWMNNPP